MSQLHERFDTSDVIVPKPPLFADATDLELDRLLAQLEDESSDR